MFFTILKLNNFQIPPDEPAEKLKISKLCTITGEKISLTSTPYWYFYFKVTKIKY